MSNEKQTFYNQQGHAPLAGVRHHAFNHPISGKTINETYTADLKGKCNCGEKVNKLEGSNFINNRDKTRYYYPDRNDGWNIFRCRNCGSVISDSWHGA